MKSRASLNEATMFVVNSKKVVHGQDWYVTTARAITEAVFHLTTSLGVYVKALIENGILRLTDQLLLAVR